MTIPTHETEEDLVNERKVLTLFCESKGLTWEKLKKFERVDAYLYNDLTPVFVAEARTRNNTHDHYDTFIITYSKVTAGRELARKLGLRYLLIVGFKDGIYFTDETDKIEDGKWRWIEHMRIQNRNDIVDHDVMLNIPLKDLMYVCPF
jgi:hypothetical protein